MFESIKTLWRYRRVLLPLISIGERMADAALAANVANMQGLHDVEETLYHTILANVTAIDMARANRLLIKIEGIEDWD